jgi:hypothetical protein
VSTGVKILLVPLLGVLKAVAFTVSVAAPAPIVKVEPFKVPGALLFFLLHVAPL